eukprot:s2526_g33.t1
MLAGLWVEETHGLPSRPAAKKALRTHQRMYDVVKMKYKQGSLLEVFAGRATLSEVAVDSGRWEVLHPQNVLYGLDLFTEEHQQMLKDVIETQKPEVIITLSHIVTTLRTLVFLAADEEAEGRAERFEMRAHAILGFVMWVWSYQTTHGCFVVLEQPAQSDALKMPLMRRRELSGTYVSGGIGRCGEWTTAQETDSCSDESSLHRFNGVPSAAM